MIARDWPCKHRAVKSMMINYDGAEQATSDRDNNVGICIHPIPEVCRLTATGMNFHPFSCERIDGDALIRTGRPNGEYKRDTNWWPHWQRVGSAPRDLRFSEMNIVKYRHRHHEVASKSTTAARNRRQTPECGLCGSVPACIVWVVITSTSGA